jgi:hypothetical protein
MDLLRSERENSEQIAGVDEDEEEEEEEECKVVLSTSGTDIIPSSLP